MSWELFRREAVEGFELVGVESDLLREAPKEGLPLACEITITAPSVQPKDLGDTEDSLDAITVQIGGRIAATVRSSNQLWVLAYLQSDDDAERFTQIPLPRGASVSVAPTRDPDWTIFERAQPVGIEEQSMLDLRVMSQLHEAGDIGGVRQIDHVVVALDASSAEQFVASARSVLGTLEARKQDTETWVLSAPGDPADITSETWTLRLIAERFGAEYDGWGCAVAGGSEPASRSKRRWFRRS